MRGLKFFPKQSWPSGGRRTLISYHSPHSATWSWYIDFAVLVHGEHKVFPIYWWQKAEKRNKTMVSRGGFRIPFIGTIRYSRQQPTWYRDLYNDLRDYPPYMIVNQEPDVVNGGRGKTVPERVSAKIIRFK